MYCDILAQFFLVTIGAHGQDIAMKKRGLSKITHRFKALTLSALAFGSASATAEPTAVMGQWLTDDHSSTVDIRDCGDGTPCGVVVAVDPAQGGIAIDDLNREESLRGREMVGVTVLEGFKNGGDVWRSGHIYNPKDGRTYRASLRLASKDLLVVSGCLGPICKKLHWERLSQGDDTVVAEAQ